MMKMSKFNIDSLNCLIDLHLHLDGAISFENAKNLMQLQGIDYKMSDEELRDSLVVSKKCNNLSEFLGKFIMPISLLQSKASIKHAVINLINELKAQGIMYAEIRFAPQLFTDEGLSIEEATLAAIDGLKATDFDGNFILCCMRDIDNIQDNIETIDVAYKYLNNGVCAIDVAGDEYKFPIDEYDYIFKQANLYGVPYTIHSGEADGPTSVYNSLKYKPSRIGHGIRSCEDEKLLDILAKENVALELCITSNLMTSIFDDVRKYPIKKLMNKNIKVTINTDDPSIEGIDLKHEYKLLIDNFNFSEKEIKQLLSNSIDASFASNKIKEKLRYKLNNSIEL